MHRSGRPSYLNLSTIYVLDLYQYCSLYLPLADHIQWFIGQQFTRIWFADFDYAVVHAYFAIKWLYDQRFTYDIVPK